MKTYTFPQEDHTEVFINAHGTITIQQIDAHGQPEIIALGSKDRAISVARAITALCKVATFKPEQEDEDGR